MAKIKIMDELLANKIAAGEVVERCASVVKELVENSIDAKSSEIKVELVEAGTKEIRVIDNGTGMEKEDALLAFSRHATSKITTEDDLFNINTLGFRGEALASIASVSKITLKTSTGNVGTIVSLAGGRVIDIKSGDARVGTSITVSDLFYNTPARLKHMKSLYTELASITEYINKLSLSHPDIKFTLINNDNVLLNTDGTDDLLKTIKNIYGIDVAKKMLPILGSNDDYDISGYISLPEVHRSSRNHIITIVNGRVVRNQEINRVINDSYHSYKPDNRYPIVVIKIEVDPILIDVNIHPTKMDIKFSKIEALETLISNLIKNAISKKNLIPKIENIAVEPLIKYTEQVLDLERKIEQKEEEIYENYDMIDNDSLFVNEDIVFHDNEIIEEPVLETPTEKFEEIYPIGVVHGTYLVCQNEKGMYLIDQHAAKERINYEYYLNKLGNPKNDSISLLFPIVIELTNTEFIILKENIAVLKNLNFVIDEFGINSVIVKAHPVWLPKGFEEEAIRRLVDIVIHQEKQFSTVKFNESIATMLSCKMAIKANENITIKEMEQIINDLRKCNNPFNCPHGRPTMVQFSKYELEKLFKRSGFDTRK
ncbi:MAG: DNA mismatch repair endonuclease MutL [Bacilli bacterium]|nr:DNA mismatch repair endonuclease MutL [Bacilli bacterium]